MREKYVTVIHVIGTGSEAGTNCQFLASLSVFDVVKTLANEAGLKKFITTADGRPVDPVKAREQTIGDLAGDKEEVRITTSRRAVAA